MTTPIRVLDKNKLIITPELFPNCSLTVDAELMFTEITEPLAHCHFLFPSDQLKYKWISMAKALKEHYTSFNQESIAGHMETANLTGFKNYESATKRSTGRSPATELIDEVHPKAQAGIVKFISGEVTEKHKM